MASKGDVDGCRTIHSSEQQRKRVTQRDFPLLTTPYEELLVLRLYARS